jgi:hypothetical protein
MKTIATVILDACLVLLAGCFDSSEKKTTQQTPTAPRDLCKCNKKTKRKHDPLAHRSYAAASRRTLDEARWQALAQGTPCRLPSSFGQSVPRRLQCRHAFRCQALASGSG